MLDLLKRLLLEEAVLRHHSITFDIDDPSVIRLGFYVIVLRDLSAASDRTTATNCVDVFLDDVLRIRKNLPPAEASDIYLMMVGPAGSGADPKWKAIAAEIERDDRLARKHVWLPDDDSANFRQFVNSTFLSEPWHTDFADVEALSLLTQGIDMPEGWEDALLDPDLEGVELVQKLVFLESGAA